MKKTYALFAVFFLTLPLRALPVVSVGNTEVHPYVSAALRYDSNIYLTPQRTGSFINEDTAGVRFLSDSNWYNIEAGYRAGILVYEADPSRNNAVHQKADFTGLFSLSELEKLRINDVFLTTTDPANLELTQRTNRVQNDFLVSYFSNLARGYGVRVKGTHQYNHYSDGTYDALNNSIMAVRLGLTYNVMKNAFLALDYTAKNYDYKTRASSNAVAQQGNVGVEGIFSRTVSGKLFAGLENRHYDYSLNSAANNYNYFVFALKAQWTTYENNFVLNIYRQSDESSYGENRFYINSHASLSFERDINKLSFSCMLAYDELEYPEETNGFFRRDKISSLSLSAIYGFFKWFSLGVNYAYRDRNSNAGGYSYSDSVTTLQTNLLF